MSSTNTGQNDSTPSRSDVRRQRFIQEYLVDANATQAAIRAGYSPRTAASQGARLLRNVKVRAQIDRAQQKRRERLQMTGEDVVRSLSAIAGVDVRRLYGPDGHLLAVCDLDDEMATSIASIDFHADGTIKRLRLCNKLNALALLGKHIGMFSEPVLPPEVSAMLQMMKPEGLALLSDEDLEQLGRACEIAKRLFHNEVKH